MYKINFFTSWINRQNEQHNLYGNTCGYVTEREYFFLLFLGESNEDCLFLNVFVPATVKPSDKMAVMVWIHGGAFAYGSASHYPAGVLATFNEVIVVSINYRLGILGFFNIPGTDYKGNYGMLDQVRYLCVWRCLCTLLPT